MTVYFEIHYKDGHSKEFDDHPCFGALQEEYDSFDDDREISSIEYHHNSDNFDPVLKDLLLNHPVLSIPILSVDSDVVSVSPDHPADLMMASLSFARTLFSNSKGYSSRILNLIKGGYKPDVAAFFVDSQGNGKYMFRYIEESLVQDWSLAGFIEWLTNPVNRSIEQEYNEIKTYSSVKSSLSGKHIGDYNWDNSSHRTAGQISELIRWEKGKDFLFSKKEEEK